MNDNENGMSFLINNLTKPVKSNFLHYTVRIGEDKPGANPIYSVYQVVDNHYPHPQAPEHAVLQRIDIEFVKDVSETSPEYSLIKMLYLNQDAVKNLIKK